MPIYDTQTYDEHLYRNLSSNLFYIELNAKVEIFDYWYIDGGIKTHIRNITDNHTFLPLESSYKLGFGYQYKGLTFGYEHLCIHSMTPFEYKINYDKIYNAVYDELFIRLDFKF